MIDPISFAVLLGLRCLAASQRPSSSSPTCGICNETITGNYLETYCCKANVCTTCAPRFDRAFKAGYRLCCHQPR